MQKILLADRQDITRAGMQFVCLGMNDVDTKYVEDKAELILSLKESPDSVVVLDYTLFDFNDADELLIFNLRFPNVRWVLFSEDLTQDFVKQIVASSNQFSVVLKESPMNEIREALRYAMSGQRYICQRTAELLLPVMRTKHQISTMLPIALLLPFPSRNVIRPTRNEICRPDTATTCIKPDLLMVTYKASSA